MPASADLLAMIRDHFDEVVNPPVEAFEIDPAFHCDQLGKNSMITIHVLKRKISSGDVGTADTQEALCFKGNDTVF